MELWLVCALLTVVCYGVGEGLSKEPTVRLGSARMLVLYAVGSAPIYAAWFVVGSGWERLTAIGMGLPTASAVCGCFGTIFWFRAMESGTASVVSGFTAAYPVITVAAAVVILGVSLVPVQIVAIAFLLIGAVVLGLHDHPGDAAVGRAWLAPMLLAIVLWGAWGILERMSIDSLGFAGNAGIYVLVSTPIYLAVASRRSAAAGFSTRVRLRPTCFAHGAAPQGWSPRASWSASQRAAFRSTRRRFRRSRSSLG